MRRTGFARKTYAPTRAPVTPIPAEMTQRIRYAESAANAEPAPKENPVRHERYRRIVAALACACCGIEGRSQAAHQNTGKGLGLKADDRLCFPMCADIPGRRGCHSWLDQGGLYSRDDRRRFERLASERTRATVRAMGLWPADLPAWPGDEMGSGD